MSTRQEARLALADTRAQRRDLAATLRRIRKEIAAKVKAAIASCGKRRKELAERLKQRRQAALVKLKELAATERRELQRVCAAAKVALRAEVQHVGERYRRAREIEADRREQLNILRERQKSAARVLAGKRAGEKRGELYEANLAALDAPDTPPMRRLFAAALRAGYRRKAREPGEILDLYLQDHPDKLQALHLDHYAALETEIARGGKVLEQLATKLEQYRSRADYGAPELARELASFEARLQRTAPDDREALRALRDDVVTFPERDDVIQTAEAWKTVLAAIDVGLKQHAQKPHIIPNYTALLRRIRAGEPTNQNLLLAQDLIQLAKTTPRKPRAAAKVPF